MDEDQVLMIVFEDQMPNGVAAWVATVQNSGTMIPFIGETVEEQQVAITRLANSMVQHGTNIPEFEREMAEVLDIPEGMTEDEAFQLLFQDTGTLFYNTEIAYEAETLGVEALADCLVDAGEALLVLL